MIKLFEFLAYQTIDDDGFDDGGSHSRHKKVAKLIAKRRLIRQGKKQKKASSKSG